MEEIMSIAQKTSSSFNTPLEAAIRAIVVLTMAYPRKLDMQLMVTLDHIIVHTEDIRGPQSLHPKLPLRNAEILVRRKIVEQGLLLLISKNLAERYIDGEGIYYVASDYAAPFLASLESSYTAKLKDRATWISSHLLTIDEQELRSLTDKVFGKWTQEFQIAGNSFGAE